MQGLRPKLQCGTGALGLQTLLAERGGGEKMKIHWVLVGLLAVGVVAACSAPTPQEACAEFGKDVQAEGVNEDGAAVYRCVPRDPAGD